MDRIKITQDILLNNGFKEVFEKEKYQKTFKEIYDIDKFFIGELWTIDKSPIKIDMIYKVTNNGADWNMHLDNEVCETIGSAHITYVDQFNKMMEIFDSLYRLK